MRQASLLPVAVEILHPPPRISKDMAGWGFGDDGVKYWIKSDSITPYLAATEFFCFELARLCGVPVPDSRFVICDGRVCFGSEDLPGETKRMGFTHAIATNQIRVHQFAEVYARTLAVDLFVGNLDRNMHNFMFFDRGQEGIRTSVIDFGMSWWARGLAHIRARVDNEDITLATAKEVARHVPFDLQEALMALQRISNLSVGQVEEILDLIPEKLLPEELRRSTAAWWVTERDSHLNWVEAGIRNGVFVQIRAPQT